MSSSRSSIASRLKSRSANSRRSRSEVSARDSTRCSSLLDTQSSALGAGRCTLRLEIGGQSIALFYESLLFELDRRQPADQLLQLGMGLPETGIQICVLGSRAPRVAAGLTEPTFEVGNRLLEDLSSQGQADPLGLGECRAAGADDEREPFRDSRLRPAVGIEADRGPRTRPHRLAAPWLARAGSRAPAARLWPRLGLPPTRLRPSGEARPGRGQRRSWRVARRPLHGGRVAPCRFDSS